MVKGITRQVILVKSPDPNLFEEAIFIVKEEALAREGVSADQVLKQARQAADGYLKQGRVWNHRLHRLSGPLWGVAGALLACVGWALWLFVLGPHARRWHRMSCGKGSWQVPSRTKFLIA
jgi:hypothetical protein